MPRNHSINDYFVKRGETHAPRYRFNAKNRADFDKWLAETRPAVISTLGVMPKKVPLNPEILVEWNEDGLIKQRIIFDVEDGLSAIAYVFRPEDQKKPLPAILCCHGHGPYGKDSVMGIRGSAAEAEKIKQVNYDYGLKMAQAGFVTMSIDWRGFGERDDTRHPRLQNINNGRDPCNVHFLRAALLGQTVLGMDVHDGMCAVDYLCQQDFVNPEKLGVMGLSFGGTMTTWMSICDQRLKAADIICYSDQFAYFGMRNVNLCGSQITPGLFALCDVSDLHGLTAPRPLLIEIGLHDDCFHVDPAMACCRDVQKIYAAAGISDKLELDLFEGGHRWGGNKSIPFFKKWLAQA
jgi:dienelactone hydrolase